MEVKPKGIADVINSPAGIIRKIIAERGDVEVKAMLVKQIIELTEFFNFARTMNIDQVSQTADLVIELFPIFTPEDFILCFKNIKTLKYGKFYEGIDGSKILEMVRAYDLDRDEQLIQYRQKEANDYKAQGKTLEPAIYQAAKGIIEKPITKSERITIVNEYDQIMQGYMSEFDKLFTHQNPFARGIRFVNYAGKDMDIATYCNKRFEEDNA